MKKDDLIYFKDLLQKQKLDILKKAEEALSEDLISQSDQVPDEMDQASSEYEKFITVRMRGRERVLLNKIEYSLKKMDNKEYGICEECEEDIPLNRMKARPVANLCIKCKEEQERKEKQYA